MRVADIRHLYEYSSWANARLRTVVSRLTPSEFTWRVAGSYGSIRNTLVHVISAEWGWLDRCGGPPRGERLDPEAYPTVGALTDVWQWVEASMRTFLAGLTDEDLAREVEFTLGGGPSTSLPRGAILQHAMIHAAHHRGQVALLLRAIGHPPGNFDFLIHAGEHHASS